MPLPCRLTWSLSISLITVGLGVGVASGCGESEPTAEAPASSTAAASAAAMATPQPAASSKPATSLRVRILPESSLKPIPGLAYAHLDGWPDAFSVLGRRTDLFEATVGRHLKRQSEQAGSVQLLRLRPGVITNDATGDQALRDLLVEFIHPAELTEIQVADQSVLIAKDLRASSAAVAAWLKDRELVILFAKQGLSAKTLATSYLTGS